MAKKSNKTEQVLKLITKESEVQDTSGETERPDVENGPDRPDAKDAPDVKDTPDVKEDSHVSEVEIKVQPAKPQEQKVETKLKIEIEPEIEIKQKEKPQEELHIKVPVSADAAPCEPSAGDPCGTPDSPSAEGSDAPDKEARTCLINLTERLVREKAKEVMERLNVCECPICTQDVLALALNSLPNKYVTTDVGRQHLLLEIYKKQYETDIIAALTRAGVRVKVSPRH